MKLSSGREGDATEVGLSRRERDVLTALARGLTDKEVGLALGIACPTVRVYRRRAEEKLGVRGLARCLLVAWKLGEIDLHALADEIFSERTPLVPNADEASGPTTE